jgi:uncharacterized protein with beta-barrel porin domain
MSETQTGIYYNGNWYGRSGNTDALDSRITQVSNNIAPRQISDTASKLIAVGEYFTDKLGRLCVCDVQIASGGSIVVGSNCHVVSEGLGNELNSKSPKVNNFYRNITASTTAQHVDDLLLPNNGDLAVISVYASYSSSNPTSIEIKLGSEVIASSTNSQRCSAIVSATSNNAYFGIYVTYGSNLSTPTESVYIRARLFSAI